MVAHTGGIGAAARQLGITQPALTAALRKLEADVGATLFVRDHRGAHLTASGRELAVVATETLRALEDAKQRIVDVEREPAGKVVIAVETNRKDPNHRILNEARERLNGARDARGRKLEVIPLPMPAPLVFDGQRLPA